MFPQVYEELRRIAHSWFLRHHRDATLQPTALVHEAYLRIANHGRDDWSNGRHFRAIAARAMRQILVDQARAKRTTKRGGGRWRVSLSGVADIAGEHETVDMVDLDETLTELARLNARHAAIVELRFFAGMSIAEAAELLELSPRTVELSWKIARAWLLTRLKERPTSQ